MAVLIEMNSVVIKKEALKKLSSDLFLELMECIVHYPSCMDESLLCIHIADESNMENLLNFVDNCKWKLNNEFAIVDQHKGPMHGCEWLSFKTGNLTKKKFIHVSSLKKISTSEAENCSHDFYNKWANKSYYRPVYWRFKGSSSQDNIK